MVSAFSRYWWLLVLRGVLAIIFGILALVLPGAAIFALVILFGVYALVDGVMAVIAATRGRDTNQRWWVLLLEGLAGIIAGIIALVWPGITAVALLFVIAFWAIVTGILEIAAAIRLRREINNEWALGLTGALSVILGIVLLVNPGAGALGLIWAIGIYAILFGVLMIYLGIRVRSGSHQPFAA